MLELRTFGGLSITVDGAVANGAAIQRKTLALLALLAATKHGISRDKLVAYLWPESDTAHGRNLLRQACYALRRDLDAPELVLGSTELRLNPDVVNSDVRQFQDALDRGDHAAAVALYQGPFLDGFFLSETEEFERWVEGERTRLAYEVSSALQLLAREAGDAGRFQAEAEHWRQLTQIDPFSARAAIGMMQALDQAGERVAAVQHGDSYQARVRKELGAEPPAELIALTERLRNQTPMTSRASAERGRTGSPAPPRPARVRPASILTAMITVVALGPVTCERFDHRRWRDPRLHRIGYERRRADGSRDARDEPGADPGTPCSQYSTTLRALGAAAWPKRRKHDDAASGARRASHSARAGNALPPPGGRVAPGARARRSGDRCGVAGIWR